MVQRVYEFSRPHYYNGHRLYYYSQSWNVIFLSDEQGGILVNQLFIKHMNMNIQ